MSYLREIDIHTKETQGRLYVTDDEETAVRLRDSGEAVLIYLHEGNRDRMFSGFSYGVEDPENLEEEYLEKAFRRLKGLPWHILETERCLIRETTPEDVDAFYEIYRDPAITEFMEGLYPEKEQERAYIREYREKVYTFYEFGVWTVLEKSSGSVIGRAGFSYREGYDEPELGFIIGVPWQRRGYAEEVCRAILEYGWNALGFERVQVLVETGNRASLHLCEKLGFRGREEVILEGRPHFRLVLSGPTAL
ncbi:MAG: GNAT family N-acetyltransferase [Roseburia sp.]|nr:GNAT family N-acetyltransferase [Roseburia sp.]MCM1096556.1 GNAT family N-acetyltransferase [Ruminococcus flavefaciens]MCM1235295.1 GNAT family N-acetyltransferase [Ruminococcus flavefaciens]